MSRSLEPAAEAVPDCEPAWVSSPEVSAPGLTTPAICAASARVHLAELAVARRRRSHPEIAGIDQHPAIEMARRPIERP